MSRPRAKMHPVRLMATKDGSGSVHFSPESHVWSDSKFVFHKDHHGMRKQDYHLVEFVLDDRTGEGLRFPDTPHDAMWVAKVDNPADPTCPGKDTPSNYHVLEPICVCDDGKRLIVRNDNPRKEQWSFTMNFVKEGEDHANVDEYVSWDPITDNHNGGSTW